MKTLLEVLYLKAEVDTKSVDNPHEWYYTEKNGVYTPIAKIDFSNKTI
jgi:hypothetical protein